jgi:hypothetical protein
VSDDISTSTSTTPSSTEKEVTGETVATEAQSVAEEKRKAAKQKNEEYFQSLRKVL